MDNAKKSPADNKNGYEKNEPAKATADSTKDIVTKSNVLPLLLVGITAVLLVVVFAICLFPTMSGGQINPDPDDPDYPIVDPVSDLPEYTLPVKNYYYGSSYNSTYEATKNYTTVIRSQKQMDKFIESLNGDFYIDDDYVQLSLDAYDIIPIYVDTDSCSEYNFHIGGLYLDDDSVEIDFMYASACGVCAPQTDLYLIPVRKNVIDADLMQISTKLNFIVTSTEHCDPNVAYKPIIYLYPEKETELSIKFSNPEKLLTSYPKYTDEWRVIAEPNGDLTDQKTGRKLYALYWEGSGYVTAVQDEGFVVKGEDSAEFLETSLAQLGLNEREAEEFIVYWLPKLEANKYNYIHFETTEDVDKYMPLELSVEPDTKIRIMMSFKSLDEPINVKTQKLSAPERKGFTLIEWGGHEIK